MALKIISGFLTPLPAARTVGSATIRFADASLGADGTAKLSDVSIIGAGDFIAPPAVQFSLRHIVFTDPDRGAFNIDDDIITDKGMPVGVKISWSAGPVAEARPKKPSKRDSQILEISVLIIGETK